LGRGTFLEQENLGEDDQRNHDGEHHHHVLVATAAWFLLGIAVFSQVLVSVQQPGFAASQTPGTHASGSAGL
jgi:hypothetical protein